MCFVIVGRQECRPSLSCFRFFLVTFAGVRRDESRLYLVFLLALGDRTVVLVTNEFFCWMIYRVCIRLVVLRTVCH